MKKNIYKLLLTMVSIFLIFALLDINILNSEIEQDRRKNIIKLATSDYRISRFDIKQIIKNKFPDILVITTDGYYKLIKNVDTVRNFLYYDNTDELEYINDIRDCDDFAIILDGNVRTYNGDTSFGIAFMRLHSCGHVMNFFIDSNYNIYFVEPQNDRIMDIQTLKEDYGDFSIDLVII